MNEQVNLEQNTSDVWTSVLNSVIFKRQKHEYPLITFGSEESGIYLFIRLDPEGGKWRASFRYVLFGEKQQVICSELADTQARAVGAMLTRLRKANESSVLVNTVVEALERGKTPDPEPVKEQPVKEQPVKERRERYPSPTTAAYVTFDPNTKLWKSTFANPDTLLRNVVVTLYKLGYKPFVYLPEAQSTEQNKRYYDNARKLLSSIRREYGTFTYVIKGKKV